MEENEDKDKDELLRDAFEDAGRFLSVRNFNSELDRGSNL